MLEAESRATPVILSFNANNFGERQMCFQRWLTKASGIVEFRSRACETAKSGRIIGSVVNE